jgi:hypothetical protein
MLALKNISCGLGLYTDRRASYAWGIVSEVWGTFQLQQQVWEVPLINQLKLYVGRDRDKWWDCRFRTAQFFPHLLSI